MALNRNASYILNAQVEATLHQARQMEEVADSFARLGISLVRIPVLLCQSLALLFALPFVGFQALTGILDRSAGRMDRVVDTRLSKINKVRPLTLPKPSSSTYPQPAAATTLRPSHTA